MGIDQAGLGLTFRGLSDSPNRICMFEKFESVEIKASEHKQRLLLALAGPVSTGWETGDTSAYVTTVVSRGGRRFQRSRSLSPVSANERNGLGIAARATAHLGRAGLHEGSLHQETATL